MKIPHIILLVLLKSFRRVWIKLTTIFLLFLLCTPINNLYSQEITNAGSAKKESIKKPVNHTFENMMLVNSPTIETLKINSLQFCIQHRFGRIDNGFKDGNNFDLLGLLGVANIRIGLNYGITNKLTVGLGATKKNYVYDFKMKYKILKQTQNRGTPVTVSYYGIVAVATIKSDDFLSFSNRLSYFNQLLIARKINKKLSLQLSPSLIYFNQVDTLGGKVVKHLNFGLNIGGRINVSASGSVIFEFNQPLTISDFGSGNKTKPSVGIGYEIATRGHVFQLLVTNAINIIDQYDAVENTNDFFKGEIYIGFNISRNWNF